MSMSDDEIKAEAARQEISNFVARNIKEGGGPGAILYALSFNLVAFTYMMNGGNRGKARDSLSEVIDQTFDVVETSMADTRSMVAIRAMNKLMSDPNLSQAEGERLMREAIAALGEAPSQ